MHSGDTPSPGLRLPGGLKGLGSQKFLLFSVRLETWQLVQPMFRNFVAPLTITARIEGSLGMTRPGTAKEAWNMLTAVTSARVISFTNPSPSGSALTPKRSVA